MPTRSRFCLAELPLNSWVTIRVSPSWNYWPVGSGGCGAALGAAGSGAAGGFVGARGGVTVEPCAEAEPDAAATEHGFRTSAM